MKPMSENETLLKVENLTVKFSNLAAIKDISFSLKRGDFLAIIGPNGSGKTVLVKALIGVLPYEGKINWQNNLTFGYVPQQVDLDRYLSLTLRDFLELKTKILRLPKKAASQTIRLIGLSEQTLNQRLRLLSGGQLQKGLIAFALIGRPDVIFFDEPTASVDSPGEEQIYDLMHRLQDQTGLTVVLVSHELDLVSRYASSILCINQKLICFGPPEEYLKPEVLKKIYGDTAHVHHI